MNTMTGYERMLNTLSCSPVDEIPIAVSPWGDTVTRWKNEGHLKEDEDVQIHFGQDFYTSGFINHKANLDFVPVTLEETAETIVQLDENGVKLRQHKLHASGEEHISYTVKDRSTWNEHVRDFLLKLDRRRIPFKEYQDVKNRAAEDKKFLCWRGLAPFEQMRAMTGHENMLMGMALDPDWVKDMVTVYSDMTIRHCEVLFAKHGKPDAMFFSEDLGFKGKPFMSPAMYEDIIMPGHTKLFGFAHSMGCKVIVHSCGYIEPLLPGLIQAGMDCLQAMEVKAGMDMPTLFKKFGDKITFFGNIDARVLISNDKAAIEKELKTKITPVIANGGGYILHSDHSEPPEVDYDTMCYFLRRGREIARDAMK